MLCSVTLLSLDRPVDQFKETEQIMKHYYIQVPGWIYSMSAYGTNKRDAIAKFRSNQGFGRMPKGFSIWEA
jgi:hypothetical protein